MGPDSIERFFERHKKVTNSNEIELPEESPVTTTETPTLLYQDGRLIQLPSNMRLKLLNQDRID